MQYIYERCIRLVVWLGGEEWQDAFGIFSKVAFQRMREYCRTSGSDEDLERLITS